MYQAFFYLIMTFKLSCFILLFLAVLLLIVVFNYINRIGKYHFSIKENQYLSEIHFHKSCIDKRKKYLNKYNFDSYDLKPALVVQKEIEL